MSRSGGGSFARTVLVGAAAAAVAVVASNAAWAVRDGRAPAPPGGGTVELAGSDAVPLVVPLTLVALACWGAVLVLRRRGRRVVAVLGGLAGLTAAGVTVAWAAGADDLDLTAWPWVVAAAAAGTAVALGRTWVAAPRWPEMSSRYDRRPGGVAGADDQGERDEPEDRRQGSTELWRALDEGRDPTV